MAFDSLILLSLLHPALSCTGSANDYSKERQFRKLNDVKNDRQVSILRHGGQRERISIFDLAVGDVVFLDTGDVVPAGQCSAMEIFLSSWEEWTLTFCPSTLIRQMACLSTVRA